MPMIDLSTWISVSPGNPGYLYHVVVESRVEKLDPLSECAVYSTFYQGLSLTHLQLSIIIIDS